MVKVSPCSCACLLYTSNVEPNRREFIKQCAFQKFCNTVLHNEACDAHKELHRHKAVSYTHLPADRLLYAELYQTGDKKKCTECGAFFASTSNSCLLYTSYYFKFIRRKQNVKVGTDLEDFDFDDYDEDEPEPDEGDGLSDEEQEDEEA